MAHTMISKKEVVRCLDIADEKLESIWRTLKVEKSDGRILITCQNAIIEVLWVLDAQYQSIKKEQRRLIENKRRYSERWFAKEMKRLSDLGKIIAGEIGKARALGDGYAWIFYKEDRHLIDEHLKCQRQLNLPPSIGRLGERAFVEVAQGFGGCFVLYHGISSFLRLGDVSFYDPQTGHISSIGEVKSERVKGDEYRLTVGVVYGRSFAPPIQMTEAGLEDRRPEALLSAAMQRRFDRQIGEIGKALNISRVADSRFMRIAGQCHFESLAKVIEDSRATGAAYEKAGDGLLLAAFRIKGESASTRAFSSQSNLIKLIDPIREKAKSILLENSEENSLFLGNIGFEDDGFPGVLPGTVPLFWWPIPVDQLHDLLFGSVLVISIYNPVHFWQKLRSDGYTLNIGDKSRAMSATKKVKGSRVLRFENVDYYRLLAQHFLVTDDSIIDMLKETASFALKENTSSFRVRISPRIKM